MAETLCPCCGKLPSMARIQLSLIPVIRKRLLSQRELIPDNIYKRIEDQWNRHIIVGLCEVCWQHGCDDMVPCKVPSEAWLFVDDLLSSPSNWEEFWTPEEIGRTLSNEPPTRNITVRPRNYREGLPRDVPGNRPIPDQ